MESETVGLILDILIMIIIASVALITYINNKKIYEINEKLEKLKNLFKSEELK